MTRAADNEILAISLALREDRPVLDRALRRLARGPVTDDVQWLATETARYLQRQARRRHPDVDEVFDALELEGDLAVVARQVSERLRATLLHEPLDVPGAQRCADAELLAAARADLRRALGDERRRALGGQLGG